MLNIETNDGLLVAADHLTRLISENPAKAITEARHLRCRGNRALSVQSLRAATLIDAGGQSGDRCAVKEGIKILQKLIRKVSDKPDLHYNLANGLSLLAKMEPHPGPEWYVATHGERRKARSLYQQVANGRASEHLRARAMINLGNELDSGYRWVEAYDYWVRALRTDPANPVAALSAAQMLSRRLSGPTQHRPSAHRVIGYYASIAAKHPSSIEHIAGPDAVKSAKSLRTFQSSWKPRATYKLKDDFARFVAEHRLALVGTVEGLDLRKKRWDDVHIPTIIEGLDAGPAVPPVFAMFNQLKADFCTARWLTYLSQLNTLRETSLYMDTLDYSLYGTGPSALVLAQRAALDILNRTTLDGKC
jgi:tetratricopeptide (TPR) repeat protein